MALSTLPKAWGHSLVRPLPLIQPFLAFVADPSCGGWARGWL